MSVKTLEVTFIGKKIENDHSYLMVLIIIAINIMMIIIHAWIFVCLVSSQFLITQILSGTLINAKLDHTLIYIVLINVACKFS